MRKLLLSLCMVLALAACKDEKKTADTRPVIKMGAILPLTGDLAYIGVSAQRALQLALEKWNKKDTKFKYELIVEDVAFDAKTVAIATNKLINRDKIRVLFSVFSMGANVATPITEKAKIIHMASAYGSDSAKGFYSFNNLTQYENTTDTMLKELKRRGVKSIGLLASNNFGSSQQTDILEKKIIEDGTIKLIGKTLYNPGTIDFRMIIQKMTAKETPELFYIDGLTPDATLVAKYLQEIIGKINLTTINDFIETPKRAEFEGLWFVESASATEEFSKEFEARFGEPVFLCGANSYDNMDLFIEACETAAKGDTVKNEDIVRQLLTVKDRKGAIGKFFIDSEGIVQSSANVKVIKNGKAVDVEE